MLSCFDHTSSECLIRVSVVNGAFVGLKNYFEQRITLRRQADPLTTQTSGSLKPIYVLYKTGSSRNCFRKVCRKFLKPLILIKFEFPWKERGEKDLLKQNRSDLFSKKSGNNSRKTVRRIWYRLPYRSKVRPEIVGKLQH